MADRPFLYSISGRTMPEFAQRDCDVNWLIFARDAIEPEIPVFGLPHVNTGLNGSAAVQFD